MSVLIGPRAGDFYDGYSPTTFLLANYPQYQDVRQVFDYTGLNFNLFDDHLKNRVAYEYTTTQHQDFNSAVDPITQTDSYKGDNSRVEYQGTWAIVQGYQAVFGVQQEKSWSDTFITYSPRARTDRSSRRIPTTTRRGCSWSDLDRRRTAR